jgi:signal transduction histidine kinase
MDEAREIAIYRVIQELLNNAIRYSDATDIEIKLEQLADGYLFRIKDNGKGFDRKMLDQSKGIGWRNIRSRIDLMQGNIDLKTAPGKGTVLNIWIP